MTDDAQGAAGGLTKLTLVTRQGCHLCEEMRAVVQEVRSEIPLEMELRDVDGDEDLRRRFGEEVPVLLVNGRKAFKYRVTARELHRRLAAERRRRLPGWNWLKGV